MCARCVKEEYEEELWRAKEENEGERQPPDAALEKPRAGLHEADVSDEGLTPPEEQERSSGVKREDPADPADVKEEKGAPAQMKEEEEEHSISQEERRIQELGEVNIIIKSPLKSDDDNDGDHRVGSQADRLFAPLSDTDDVTSHSSDIDDEHSKGEMTLPPDEKCCKCPQCDKTFFNKSKLERHMRTHSGDKPYACSVCGKTFTWKAGLMRHTRTHTGEKPFPCSVCGERFAHKEQLGRHTTTHTGETHFGCSVCGKIFTWKTGLIRHTRSHTGEKPFPCSVCGKTFSQKTTLIRHTRTHTGEKPFACSVCGQRFTQKGNLEKHGRRHTLVIPSVNFCLLNLPPNFH
ncbi:histone-lysine N-methyltransferase PRDM9-like [Syngnathoides biaculeatus]|uniref:histone-lysine N-methyltransferase PRDM9-like n=1 Tax=Syngnathoides biaculeatus TaxID=300417 RepID=UPI002ADE6C8F|nr:histone-lysine N-methyltransferase PRDM9-like [Syngnathoides biaculeatus]